jgi:mono/diheme cytochrome c family protein
MKKIASFSIAAALVAAAAVPAMASAKMVADCKKLGIAEIKGCASCHKNKEIKQMSEKDLHGPGAWLMEQKAAKKADKCDMAWLKEYFAKK